MITPYDSGGLLLSYKCNSRCRHCLYGCSPRWRKWLSITDAHKIIDGLRRVSDVSGRGIHLAGGEPFLDFPRLLAIQRIAVEHCVRVAYVETNAGWCVDEDDTREKFELLKDAGLDAVLISSSPYHAEFIPVKRVVMAIKVALEVFGPEGVLIWVSKFLRQLVSIDTQEVILFDRYVKTVGMSEARHSINTAYQLIGGGRAGANLGEFFHKSPPEAFFDNNCQMELFRSGHAHFDPWGHLIPSMCAGISLGDARDLPKLVKELDITKMPVVQTLAEEGMVGLYRLARRDFDYEPEPDGYMDKCHLCVSIRKHIAQRTRKFKELAPVEYYEQI